MDNSSTISVVWLKRDLRLRDHAPLKAAIEVDHPVLLFYCFEPSVMADPNYDLRHWRFVYESLADLNRQLARIAKQVTATANVPEPAEWLPFIFDDVPDVSGTLQAAPNQVYVFHREVIDVLNEIATQFTINTIFSHEETGLRVTYDRDKAVAAWCRERNVPWQEFQNNGVIRRLRDRDGWPAVWQRTMRAPQQHPALDQLRTVALSDEQYTAMRGADPPATFAQPNANFQPGGESNAHRYLQSWVTERIALYGASISKPRESRRGCSRLSPYIAWGCLSIRQVFQGQLAAKESIGFKGQFVAFASRLRWHCHFIQKFETEDRMEFENVNRGFDSLEKNVDPAAYHAWATGHTGYPLVDACMRCLHHTGYINFRMRAMLMSFLTHHLFQHWQEGAIHLARVFTDFEPGIHYAQTQMQAGMTGTNTVRIYNPIKQSQDHDPEGIFIKEWVPELAKLPVAYIHEPWTMPPLEQDMYNFHVGHDYPAPVVDIAETAREAQRRLYGQRKNDVAKAEKERILKRHAIPRTQADKKKPKAKLAAETPMTDEPEEAVGIE